MRTKRDKEKVPMSQQSGVMQEFKPEAAFSVWGMQCPPPPHSRPLITSVLLLPAKCCSAAPLPALTLFSKAIFFQGGRWQGHLASIQVDRRAEGPQGRRSAWTSARVQKRETTRHCPHLLLSFLFSWVSFLKVLGGGDVWSVTLDNKIRCLDRGWWI